MTEAAAGEDGRACNVVVTPLMKDYTDESRTLLTDNFLNELDFAHSATLGDAFSWDFERI